MEIIRKKICFDKLLSHRNGLMPYISKDIDFDGINYINTVSNESNYNTFPCDFVFKNSKIFRNDYSGGGSLSYRKDTEITRLRYLDIISWYNQSMFDVNNGIFLKRIPYEDNVITHIHCSNSGNTITTEPINTYAWKIVNDVEISKYDCVLIDSSFLNLNSNGLYFVNNSVFNEISHLKTLYGDNFENIDEATDEERFFIEKYEMFMGDENTGSFYGEVEYFYAINGYDVYKKHENLWNDWWEKTWGAFVQYMLYDRWEKYIFEKNYVEPLSLKFFYDVEKYILGKVKVPEVFNGKPISGIKVPNYVYYFNYLDYHSWFINHIQGVEGNEELKKEWDARGGINFMDFLETITPKFFKEELNEPIGNDVNYYSYESPNIEIQLSLCDEFNNENSYATYEYSVNDEGNVVNGTVEYICPEENMIGSALTPTFMTYDGEIYCESKLNMFFSENVYYINRDVYGVFDVFNDDGKGQLFKCTYYTGETIGESKKYVSGYVKTFVKNLDNDWIETSTVEIPETYIQTTVVDKMPKIKTSTYQVVGITEISSSLTVTNGVFATDTSISDDGLFKSVSATCEYNKIVKKQYSWFECTKSQLTGVTCADGEDIVFKNKNVYRNLLILSCLPNICKQSFYGDYYYFMVKYDNGYTDIGNAPTNEKFINLECNPKPLKLPYETSRKMNVEIVSSELGEEIKYDKILSEIVDDDKIIFEYVIGATEGKNINESGIHYKDVYDYKGNIFIDVVIDEMYDAKLLYEKVDYDAHKESAYSKDLDAIRTCITSEITGMEVGTQWTNISSLYAFLFTDDIYDNLIDYPKINVNISYNRGKAAAWENHFKLSECNTYEDLENYGNNYFNL